jgi:hypothetical protein
MKYPTAKRGPSTKVFQCTIAEQWKQGHKEETYLTHSPVLAR